MTDTTVAGPEPSVGIFWGVREAQGPWHLVHAGVPLAEAEPYGDFLTYPDGHYETWEGWRRLGPGGLGQRGLPALIAWHEYEHFPRGRVVYDSRARLFTFYADRRLQAPGTVAALVRLFGLDPAQAAVRSDPHYRSSL